MMRALHSRRREVAVPAWAFLLFSVTLDEWLLHFFTLTEFSVIRFFCLTLFSLSFAAGLGFIVSFIPRDRARRITAAVLSGVFAVCCLGEFFIRDAFRQFMTPASIIAGAGGVAGEYSGMTFELIGRGWWRFLLYFAPIVAYLLLDRRRGRTAVRAARQAALAIICAVTFMLAHVLTLTVSPDKNRYAAEYSFDGAVHAFGLSAAVRLEMQHLLFPARGALGPAGSADVGVSQPEDSGQNSSDAADVPPKDNTLPIDYAALAAAADDEELAQIYRYVARQTPSTQNAYTGLFKGKNLILITAEAFSAEAIDPQRTPTLYQLANKGIRFTDYYQPAWGGSTSTGEYANLMGLVPTAGVSSMKRTVGHDLRHTIGNGLLRLGYHATAYHDHTYSYYDRDKTHKNFGYTEYIGIGNGMEAGVRKTWPESDREMMRFTAPQYIGKQPFSVYYMTVSGHCNYTRMGNYIVDKNFDLLPDDGRGELVHGYLAGQLELEYGMQELVRSLEEAGIADDTVIVLSTDHYPYGLDKEQTNGKNGLTELYGYAPDTVARRDHSALIVWSGCLEDKNIVVDAPTYSLDILPTLCNLFGIDYDSRLLVGRDVFSDTAPLVLWNDYSWMTDLGFYDAAKNRFTPNDGVTVPDGYVSKISAAVRDKIRYSGYVLEHDFFAGLPKEN